MKSFFGTIAIIGLALAGADSESPKIVYIVNALAAACFAAGAAGLLREIRRGNEKTID